MPPPSTAPAILQSSRAGHKRAPIIKALEAKRSSGPGRGKGIGRARRGAQK
jgi:hypothetical protein